VNERHASGRGQYLDMCLHDCGMALLHPQAANFFLNGKRPRATGNPHPNISPYSKFATRTCEIFVAVGNEPAWRKFCDFLNLAELPSDPRFATNALRVTNRAELEPIIEARLAEEDGRALCAAMLRAGLPAGPVLHVDEAMEAAHTAHREMVTELDGYRGLGTPIKLSRTPGGTRAAPPRFNQHGQDILARHGFSAEEIDMLTAQGILVRERRA
jgi:formyl-CoA transferase